MPDILDAARFTGYHPADVFKVLGDVPHRALFTTFTFSPDTFHQLYLTPLLHHGCGDVTVLADGIGYSQSLFCAATVQGIGTDYRLRQVAVTGAFHAKLVLLRTPRSVLVGVGSGNLTASGLLTNAEVGALYRLEQPSQIAAVDNLMLRLRSIALLEEGAGDPTAPVRLADDARLLTSLDAPIFDQIDPPADIHRIEIVSPFIDGQQDVLAEMRRRWPGVRIKLRIDPAFGALTESLLSSCDDRTEVLVAEPTGARGTTRRPPVHGKLICFIGDTTSVVLLGSANLSRPALLTKENFEAVVERRLASDAVDGILAIPGIRWRKARAKDCRGFHPELPPRSSEALIASVAAHRLRVSWKARAQSAGVVRIYCRGRCTFEQRFEQVARAADRHYLEVELSSEVRETLRESCLVELRFDDEQLLRGWIEVSDRLGLSPETKQQFVLIDTIASDPLDCHEKDVVKFIELLQRNLESRGREHCGGAPARAQDGKPAGDYDETPVARRMLLETGEAGIAQSPVMARLVNRTLDTALHDLRFFLRDGGSRRPAAPKQKTPEARSGLAEKDTRDAREPVRLPVTIETVLGDLFGQLAAALDAAESPRNVAHLVSQIPTCLKALSYAAERWLPHSERMHHLHQYFHKVVVACLAPGTTSSLCSTGAVRRLPTRDRANLTGGQEFVLGVAALKAYLLEDYQAQPWPDGSFMKDMLDILDELPAPTSEALAAAGEELAHLRGPGNVNESHDYEQVLSQARKVTGELAGLRHCRAALLDLVAHVNQGIRDPTSLRHLAESASGKSGAGALQELVSTSAAPITIAQVKPDGDACPVCHRTFPLAAKTRLRKATNVHRCSNCGVFLVRSLES
jgi:hypothetical protein